MLHIVKTDKASKSDDVNRIAQALCDLIVFFDIETHIENGETPRGYIIDPAKGILRQHNGPSHDAVLQLGITLLGRMLFERGGIALMQRVRDQVVAQHVADADGLRGSYGDLIDGNEHRRWLLHLFKVCWKGIET